MPPALGRFSTTTGWPKISWSGCATIRAARSVPPPAPKPTMILMVRVGQSCAVAGAGPTTDSASAASAMNARALVMAILPAAERGSHLLIRLDNRLPFRAGALEPVGGELVADLLEAIFQGLARLQHLHAFFGDLLVVPLGLALPNLPAAVLGDLRHLQDRLLGRLVERVERRLVDQGDVARDPGARVVEVGERLPHLGIVTGRARRHE